MKWVVIDLTPSDKALAKNTIDPNNIVTAGFMEKLRKLSQNLGNLAL
jgi:hypothetical protein